jgi:RNA 2',3'-cyclic 3'-phosphodiesterase
VSPEVRGNLVRVEEELRKTGADLKPVEIENLHFTVKFLGDVPDSVIEEVEAKVRPLSLPRMEVDVRGLGAFPDEKNPRVVWAGVGYEDLDMVSKSAQQVIDALRGIGEKEERAYHPHITLARVRSPTNLEALEALIAAYASKDFGRTPIMMLKLKSSTLTPRGAAYRDIKEYPLR